MFRRRAPALLGLLGILALMLSQALVPAFADDKKPGPPPEDEEVKLGRENAAVNDSQVKLITDAALVERVNRIGQEIAAVANKEEVPAHWGTSNVKKFDYTFKIVDDKDVNAYSLPGGFIYVNKGLLDYVHSDDELAGVLAHEISHDAHHHMLKLIKEQEKLQRNMLLPLIGALILSKGSGESVGNLIIAGQLYMVAKLNTYGMEAEKDADQTAVHYLLKTKYNPVGILTFMERLAQDELRGPEREMGIYRTHPPSPERARALLAELEELHVAINRRAVDPNIAAQVSTSSANGVTLAEVKMNKLTVARMAAVNGQTAETRAKSVSDTLNRLFDQGLQMYEVKLSPDKTRVIARMQTILSFTPEDAAAQKAPASQLAQDALNAIKSLLWQDQFNRVPAASADSH
jgi:predicted Zn-dependent protease